MTVGTRLSYTLHRVIDSATYSSSPQNALNKVLDILHVSGMHSFHKLLWRLSAHPCDTVNDLLLVEDKNEGGHFHASHWVLPQIRLLISRVLYHEVTGYQACYCLSHEAKYQKGIHVERPSQKHVDLVLWNLFTNSLVAEEYGRTRGHLSEDKSANVEQVDA